MQIKCKAIKISAVRNLGCHWNGPKDEPVTPEPSLGFYMFSFVFLYLQRAQEISFILKWEMCSSIYFIAAERIKFVSCNMQNIQKREKKGRKLCKSRVQVEKSLKMCRKLLEEQLQNLLQCSGEVVHLKSFNPFLSPNPTEIFHNFANHFLLNLLKEEKKRKKRRRKKTSS